MFIQVGIIWVDEYTGGCGRVGSADIPLLPALSSTFDSGTRCDSVSGVAAVVLAMQNVR